MASERFPAVNVPHTYLAPGLRGNMLPIGRPVQGADAPLMSQGLLMGGIATYRLTILWIPDQDVASLFGRSDQPTIGRGDNVCDWMNMRPIDALVGATIGVFDWLSA